MPDKSSEIESWLERHHERTGTSPAREHMKKVMEEARSDITPIAPESTHTWIGITPESTDTWIDRYDAMKAMIEEEKALEEIEEIREKLASSAAGSMEGARLRGKLKEKEKEARKAGIHLGKAAKPSKPGGPVRGGVAGRRTLTSTSTNPVFDAGIVSILPTKLRLNVDGSTVEVGCEEIQIDRQMDGETIITVVMKAAEHAMMIKAFKERYDSVQIDDVARKEKSVASLVKDRDYLESQVEAHEQLLVQLMQTFDITQEQINEHFVSEDDPSEPVL